MCQCYKYRNLTDRVYFELNLRICIIVIGGDYVLSCKIAYAILAEKNINLVILHTELYLAILLGLP